MELARIVVQAILVIAAMIVLDQVSGERALPGLTAILNLVRWGAFVPFAASATASANNHKGAVIAVLAITLLLGWPASTTDLATQITPIGAGVVLGSLAAKLVQEQR